MICWDPCRLHDCPFWLCEPLSSLFSWFCGLYFSGVLGYPDFLNSTSLLLLGSQSSKERYLGVRVSLTLLPTVGTLFLLVDCITHSRHFKTLCKNTSGWRCTALFIPSFRPTSHLLWTLAIVQVVQILHLFIKISLSEHKKQGNHWMCMHVLQGGFSLLLSLQNNFSFFKSFMFFPLCLACPRAFRLRLHWLVSPILFHFFSFFLSLLQFHPWQENKDSGLLSPTPIPH